LGVSCGFVKLEGVGCGVNVVPKGKGGGDQKCGLGRIRQDQCTSTSPKMTITGWGFPFGQIGGGRRSQEEYKFLGEDRAKKKFRLGCQKEGEKQEKANVPVKDWGHTEDKVAIDGEGDNGKNRLWGPKRQVKGNIWGRKKAIVLR